MVKMIMSELELSNISTSKFIWKTTKGIRLYLMLYILVEVINDVVGIFVAQYFNKKMINYLNIENPILKTGLFFVFLYACLTNITYVTKSISIKPKFKALNHVKKNVRVVLFNHTLHHSMNYFNNSLSGSLTAKINNATNSVERILDSFNYLICYIIIFSIIPIVYSDINLFVGIAFIIISSLYITASAIYRKKIKNIVAQRTEEKSKYFGIINDNFTNILNVKMFSREKYEKIKSKKQSIKILRTNAKIVEYEIYYKIINLIFCFSLFFCVIGISSHLLAQNKITIADFTYILIIVSIARFVINQGALKIVMFTIAKSELNNSLETLLKPIEVQNKNLAKPLKSNNGKIVFKNINFNYKKEVT